MRADLDRRDHVAERLGHLLDLSRLRVEIEREAVREHLPVGGGAALSDTDEQRGVEPSSVLIVPFQIHVRGPGEPARGEDGLMGHARLEPDIDNLLLGLEPFPARAAGADDPLGNQAVDPFLHRGVGHVRATARIRPPVPRVRAFRAEQARDVREELRIADERRLIGLVDEAGLAHHGGREMHQSGRLAIMFAMRSSPYGGIHFAPAMASRARARSAFASMATNHCGVARNRTGFLHRQQCG